MTIVRRYQRRLAQGSRGGSLGLVTPNYLARDEFTTAQGAPLGTPRTMEPGPGTWTVTGTTQSIAGGKYVFPSAAAGGLNTPVGFPFARTPGLAMVILGLDMSAITTDLNIGWRTTAGLGTSLELGIRVNASNWLVASTAAGNLDGTPATATAYDLAIVLRSRGGYLLRRLSGAANPWTLLYVEDVTVTDPLFTQFRHNAVAGVVDAIRWPTGWFLPRRYYSPSGTIGVVDAGVANFVAKLRCAGTGTQQLIFRRQDANNYWYAERAATTLRIFEVVAGTPTQRASTNITAGDGDILHVVADGTAYMRAHRVTSNGATNSTVVYTSGSNFAAATSFAISDQANYSEFEVYNRVQNSPFPLAV
jgi:hypothetical protein